MASKDDKEEGNMSTMSGLSISFDCQSVSMLGEADALSFLPPQQQHLPPLPPDSSLLNRQSRIAAAADHRNSSSSRSYSRSGHHHDRSTASGGAGSVATFDCSMLSGAGDESILNKPERLTTFFDDRKLGAAAAASPHRSGPGMITTASDNQQPISLIDSVNYTETYANIIAALDRGDEDDAMALISKLENSGSLLTAMSGYQPMEESDRSDRGSGQLPTSFLTDDRKPAARTLRNPSASSQEDEDAMMQSIIVEGGCGSTATTGTDPLPYGQSNVATTEAHAKDTMDASLDVGCDDGPIASIVPSSTSSGPAIDSSDCDPLSFQPIDDEAAAVAAHVAAQRVHQHHHQYPPLDPHSHHAAAAQLYSSNLSRPPLPPLAPYPGENVSNYASLGYPHEANAAAAAGLAYHLSDSAQIPSRYDDETMIQSLTDRIATSGSLLTVSGLSYSYHRSQMEDAGLGDFSMVTTEHNEGGSGIHADELVVYSNLLKPKVPSIATIESSKATVDTSVPPPPPPEVDVNQDTGVKVVKITNAAPSEADAYAEIDARFVSTTAADNVVYLYDQNALGSEAYYQKFKAQHEIFIRTGSKSGREKIHEGLVDGIKNLGGIFLKSSPGGVAQVLEMNDSEVAGKVWDFLQQKCFVDFNRDQDVRKGRGGHGKRYPANQRYLDKKDALRTLYVGADYETKNKLAHELVDSVGNAGGRFVDKLDDGRFYVFEHKKALEKAKQALRENRKG